MKINIDQHQMEEFKLAVETAALRNCRSNRYQFFFFDKTILALGIKPSRDTLKKAHTMIREGRTSEEIRDFVLSEYSLPLQTSSPKLNEVQHRLIRHIVHTFRRLLRQRDESWVDSFLVMQASSYCYTMLGGPAPGGCDTDTLIRMLKDGSTDEEIIKWYMGDFAVHDFKVVA